MRFPMVVLFISLLCGCQIVGESDEALSEKVESLKVKLHEKDVEIYKLEQTLDDSRYTTWKFCSASEGWFWFDFFCYSLGEYPDEWKRAGPIEWGRVGELLSLPAIGLGLLFGVFFMIGKTFVKECFSNRRVAMMVQKENAARAHADMVVSEAEEEAEQAYGLTADVHNLSVEKESLQWSVHDLTERFGLMLEEYQELGEKLETRKKHLGITSDDYKDESEDCDEDDSDSDLF